MNLQVSVPHQKCVYSCPMCVARSHKNEGIFENLYKTNKKECTTNKMDIVLR